MICGLQHSFLPILPYKINAYLYSFYGQEFYSAYASYQSLHSPTAEPSPCYSSSSESTTQGSKLAAAAPGPACAWPSGQVALQPHQPAHQVIGILGDQAVAAIAVPILLYCDILPLLALVFTHASKLWPKGSCRDCWRRCWGVVWACLVPPDPSSIHAT